MKPSRNSRTVDDWAEIISARWQDNVAAIFEVGNMLEAAREELGAARFAILTRDKLKYDKGTISKLMAIVEDEKLRDVAYTQLPPSWYTLYILTRLTSQQFSEALESGAIHPGMEQKDARALQGPVKKKEQNISKISRVPWSPVSIATWLHTHAQEALVDIPPTGWSEMLENLKASVVQIEELIKERSRRDAA